MKLTATVALAAFALSSVAALPSDPLVATSIAGKNVAQIAQTFAKNPALIKPAGKIVPGLYHYEIEIGKVTDNDKHLQAAAASFGVKPDQIKVTNVIKNKLYQGATFKISADHDPEVVLKAAIPGAKQIWPVRSYPRPKPVSIQKPVAGQTTPPGFTSIETGVQAAHDAGHFGKGVTVAVIDTGVYYKHPALGGGYGPGFKIKGGYDLVGDAYNGVTDVTLRPDNDPMDNCSDSSHGTHTTGIIGADTRGIKDPAFRPLVDWVGVAPQADLLHYRVFGCDGSVGDDVLTAAVYKAFEDGADVISMSIGGPGDYADTPFATAVSRVAKAGTYTVGSAGNNGGEGFGVTGSTAMARDLIAVASFDSRRQVENILLDSTGKEYGFGYSEKGPAFNKTLHSVLVLNNPAYPANDGCTPATTNAAAIKGKIAMFSFNVGPEGCGSAARCGNAAKAGAIGCILQNTEGSSTAATGNDAITGAVVDFPTGEAIKAAIKANPNLIFSLGGTKDFPQATAGTPSSFTSLGMSADLFITPTIAAIGGHVYSTGSPHAAAIAKAPTPYLDMSGTSMSCPQLAGIAALYIEAKGRDWVLANGGLDRLRRTLVATAKPGKIFNTDLLSMVFEQGAGLANAYAAITASSTVKPWAFQMNDTTVGKQDQVLSIYNKGNKPVTYKLKHSPAALAYGKDQAGPVQLLPVPKYTAEYAKVTFSKSEVTVPAWGSVNVDVKIVAPKVNADLIPAYSGYINVVANNNQTFSVPYAGLVGSWKKAPIFVRENSTYVTGIFDADGNQITEDRTKISPQTTPIVVQNVLSTSSRLVYIDVVDATETLPGYRPSLGLLVIPSASGVGFSSWTNHFRNYGTGATDPVADQLTWTGYTSPDSKNFIALADGDYQLRFTALKHFGDFNKPEDYEVFLTPVVTIENATGNSTTPAPSTNGTTAHHTSGSVKTVPHKPGKQA
ncbi:peptidase S8/S53 domain-containing protein [Fimicolochytrium jonesii]|uniref:peptidase S8/S53 domain-containing protein n=1 Tax=Fimicolochytrium jonesii TaxID=1396493 RepID=UPI0022FF208E|nr:peptidase S8/S53 domain-containing protein [Fimicolochytrium jonesii]KAI8817914.1 peptidase S8/S53 domain-containing protein [Fimicolochytrium jonesii]